MGKTIKTMKQIKSNGSVVVLPSVFVGNLYVYVGVRLDASKLGKVVGNLYVYGHVQLPALTRVGGNLYVDGAANLPALTKVDGDIRVYGEAKLNAPKLKLR